MNLMVLFSGNLLHERVTLFEPNVYLLLHLVFASTLVFIDSLGWPAIRIFLLVFAVER